MNSGDRREKGYLALVLHGHLPYVRHPEHEEFLEEDWLYEAITETYIPLLGVFEGIAADGLDFRLTLSLSPTLLAMLSDELLQERYIRRINRLVDLADREVERTRRQPAFEPLARMYSGLFRNARTMFEVRYDRDLVAAFRKFQDRGNLEIITCAATHAFLPLMPNRSAVRAQVLTAVRHHELHLGRPPSGIWLPECGFDDGVDAVIREAGLRYFFVDAHGLFHARPRPRYGAHAPLRCPSGVAAFGRDIESSKQVWSSVEGYPGDGDYRDFYRDAGYDLAYDYIRPYLHPDGFRSGVGIKYHRITGPGGDKEPYDRQRALEKASQHAADFVLHRRQQAERLSTFFRGRRPVIVAPYDAELFGHWWFEGPNWLDQVLRRTLRGQDTVRLVTPSEYLDLEPDIQDAVPSASSWGSRGYNEVWLDGTNDWIYRHLHLAAERMVELARKHPLPDERLRRALNQAARELMLAQSSDWAFIMRTGGHGEYAVRRTREHLLRFSRLYDEVRSSRIDEAWLRDIEYRDKLFPEIDYRVYA